jgi:hypothetical protein
MKDTCATASSYDNDTYKVVCKYNNREKAANILAILNEKAWKLINHLLKRYSKSKNIYGTLTRNLYSRYGGPQTLIETDPNNGTDDTSFTINKGALISMCLRGGNNGTDIHDLNTITFAFLHELGHVACNTKQHGPEFWSTFKFILLEAEKIGIYEPVNYENNPVFYCDTMMITHSPYYDTRILMPHKL